MARRMYLVLVCALGIGCSSESSTPSPQSSGASGAQSGSGSGEDDPGEAQVGGARPEDSGRPAWRYGNAADEEAYCDLYSRAEAMVACEPSPVLQTSRRASCTKLTACYRTIFEPDFLERQRKCLEEKLACSRPDVDSCEELAGKTYTAGATFASACEAKKASCKQIGSKLDLGCGSLAALSASARKAGESCFASSTACTDVVSCMVASFGGACENQ